MPRMPCFKFGIKLGSANALKDCIESERTGFYLRVLQQGSVSAGNPIDMVVKNMGFPTVHDIHRLRFQDKRDAQGQIAFF